MTQKPAVEASVNNLPSSSQSILTLTEQSLNAVLPPLSGQLIVVFPHNTQ